MSNLFQTMKKNWLKSILVIILIIVLFYLVSLNDLIFRVILLCLSLFAVGIALFVLNKVNAVVGYFEENRKNVAATTVTEKQEDIEEHKEESVDDGLSRDDFDTQKIKEEELSRAEMDKTMILDELFERASLNEEEKQLFNERIREKDSEIARIQQDLIQFRDKVYQFITDKTHLFAKKETDMESVAKLLPSELIFDSSFTELNEKFKALEDALLPETVESFKESGYVDDEFNLTRMGYKELIRAAKK